MIVAGKVLIYQIAERCDTVWNYITNISVLVPV